MVCPPIFGMAGRGCGAHRLRRAGLVGSGSREEEERRHAATRATRQARWRNNGQPSKRKPTSQSLGRGRHTASRHTAPTISTNLLATNIRCHPSQESHQQLQASAVQAVSHRQWGGPFLWRRLGLKELPARASKVATSSQDVTHNRASSAPRSPLSTPFAQRVGASMFQPLAPLPAAKCGHSSGAMAHHWVCASSKLVSPCGSWFPGLGSRCLCE